MMFLNKLFIKFLSLFLVFNFTFVSSLKAETLFIDSFSVAAQDDFPVDLAFNTDGTKMFVLGARGDDVNEYTLSTGFDVSTASFVDSFSVAGQANNPEAIAFNTDGTKMFVVGAIGDDVNEYTLSIDFDINPPDPTTNKDVIGLIDAQVQGAKRLAELTTNSILDRIWHVRSQDPMGETSQQDINISFSNPDLTLASSLVTMPKIPNLNPFQGFQTEEWSTWTKADITIGKIGDTSLSSVQDISIQGVSIGADRKADNDLSLIHI